MGLVKSVVNSVNYLSDIVGANREVR